jgi:foldase protein PrsA
MTRRGIHSAISGTLAALAVAGVALSVSSCTPAERAQAVARVNGEAITSGELLHELRRRRGAATLVDIIDTELIERAAEQAGITASEEEMRVRWQRAIAEAGSETDMRAILEQRGISEEQYRERLRTDLLLDKIAGEAMTIHEQEIEDFYREHSEDYQLGERTKARMILVSTEADARHIHEALQEPTADFAGLATALSADPGTRDRGGEMGWFERDDYARAITDRAFAMDEGELSEPFEVPDGWVILKVEGHREPGHQPLEEVREEVRARIARMKLPAVREDWMRQAREQATIQIRDEGLREATLLLLQHAPPPQRPTLLPVPPPG